MNRLQKLLSIEGYDGINEVVLESPCFELDQDGEVFSHVFLGMTKDELLIGVQTIPDYHDLSDIVQKTDVDLEIDGLILKSSIPLEWLRFYVVDDRSRKFAICSCLGSIRYFELCNTPDGSDELWLKWLDFISQQDDPQSFGFKSWYFYDNHRVEKCHLEFIKRPYPFYCVETIGSQTSDTLLDQPLPSIHALTPKQSLQSNQALNIKLSSGKISRQALSTKSSLRQLSNQSVCAKLSAELIMNHPLPCFKNSKQDLVSIKSKYNIDETLAYNEWLTAGNGRDLKRSGSCSTIMESSPFSPTIRKYSVFSLVYQACNGDKDKAIEQIGGYFPHKDNSDEIFKIYAEILWYQKKVNKQSNEHCSLKSEPSISELISGNNLADLALDQSANLSPQKLSFLKRKLLKTRAGLSKLENVVNTVVLENTATLKKPMPFTQFTPPEFSREIMLMVSEKIVKITQIDFQKLQFKVMPASVKILLDNYHAISTIISDDINSSDYLPRDKLIAFYIKVADYCFNHGYLQCCEAVIVGICSPPVYSNIEDWITVTENSPKEFKLLVKMINIMFDARNYLEHLRVHIEKRNLRLPIHDHFLMHVWGARPDMNRFKEREEPEPPEIDIVKKESGSKLMLWITRSFSSNTKLKTTNSKSLLKRTKSDIHSRGWNTERVDKEHLKNSKSAHEIKASKTDTNGDVCKSDSKIRKSKLKKSGSNISRRSSTHVVHETESSQYIQLTDEQILDIQTKMAHKFCEEIIAESLEILRNETRSDKSLSSINNTSIGEHPYLSHQSIEHLSTAIPDHHKHSNESVENQQQQQNTRSQEYLQKRARSMEPQLQHRTQSYEHLQKRIQFQEQQPQGVRSYEQTRIQPLEQAQRRAHSLDILSGYSQTGESDVKPVSSKNVSSSKQNSEKTRKEKKKGCLLWKRSKEKTSDHSPPLEIESQHISIDSEGLPEGVIPSQEQQPHGIRSYEQLRMQSLEQQPQTIQSYKQLEYITESNEEQLQAIEPYKQQPQVIHSLEKQPHSLRAFEQRQEATQSHEQKQYRIQSQEQPSVQSHKNLQQRAHSSGHMQQRTRFDELEQRRAHSLDILSGYSQTGESDVKPVSSKNVSSSKQNSEKTRNEKKKGFQLLKRSKEKTSGHSLPSELDSQYRSIDSGELQEGLMEPEEIVYAESIPANNYFEIEKQRRHIIDLGSADHQNQETQTSEHLLKNFPLYNSLNPSGINSLNISDRQLYGPVLTNTYLKNHPELSQEKIASSVHSKEHLQSPSTSKEQLKQLSFRRESINQTGSQSKDEFIESAKSFASSNNRVSSPLPSADQLNNLVNNSVSGIQDRVSNSVESQYRVDSPLYSKDHLETSVSSQGHQNNFITSAEINSPVVSKDGIKSPAASHDRLSRPLSQTERVYSNLPLEEKVNSSVSFKDRLIRFITSKDRLNSSVTSKDHVPPEDQVHISVSSEPHVNISVLSKDQVNSPSQSIDHLNSNVLSSGHVNSSVTSKDFVDNPVSSQVSFYSPVSSKGSINSHITSKDRMNTHIESVDRVNSPVASTDCIKSSLASADYIDSFVNSSPISSTDRVNRSVVSTEHVNSPVSYADRVNGSVGSQERISSPVSSADRVNRSVASVERVTSPVSSTDRVNESVVSKEHISSPVSSADRVNRSVVSKERITSPVSSADRVNRSAVSKECISSHEASSISVRSPVSSAVRINSPVVSEERVRSPVPSIDPVYRSAVSAERVSSPEASTIRVKSPVASKNRVNSLIYSGDRENSPLNSTTLINSSSKNHVNNPVSSKDIVNNPLLSSDNLNSSFSLKDRLKSFVTGTSKDQIKSHTSKSRSNSPFTSTDRVNSPVVSRNRLRSPVMSADLVNSPLSSLNRVNSPVPSQDHFDSPVESNNRVNSPVVSMNRLRSPVMSVDLVNSPLSSKDHVNSPMPSTNHFDSPVESKDCVNSPIASEDHVKIPVSSKDSPGSLGNDLNSSISLKDRFKSCVTGTSKDQINSPLPIRNRLNSTVTSADRVNSPVASKNPMNSPVASDDHVNSPVASKNKVNSYVASENRVNSPVTSKDRFNSPVASKNQVNNPVASEDRVNSHVASEDRLNGPVPSQDRFYSPVVSKDRINNPALSSYLNSFVSLKDHVNSPLTSTDSLQSVVKSTVGLDNPIPSLNHLVNNSDLSEDHLNSKDDPLNCSNDRLYSPIPSQDHCDSPVESNDRVNSLVVSKKRLNSPVASEDRVKSPVASKNLVNSSESLRNHVHSSISLKDRLKSFVTSTSKDQINSPLPIRSPLNSTVTSADRVNSHIISNNRVKNPVASKDRVNSSVASENRVNSPVASKNLVNSPVASKDRVNSPVGSKNQVNNPVASEDRVNSPLASKNQVNSPVASEDRVNSHVLSKNLVNSPVASEDRVNGPVLSKDRFYSHAVSSDRMESPVPSQDRFYTPVVSNDRMESPVSSQDRFYSPVASKDPINNPALSSHLNSIVSLKDRVNSPITSTDSLHTVVKSTVGLDNPIPSLNHLLNNSDLSEDHLNSTDDPMNSSNDRLNSPIPSQDHCDSPVESNDRVNSLVVSKKRLNSPVASEDRVKSPVASKDLVNSSESLRNHQNSSISLKDRLKSFVIGTSKDQINSPLPIRSRLNSTVTSTDRVNSPLASENRVNSPVASKNLVNNSVTSKDRVNIPVGSKIQVNSPVVSEDRVNSPIASKNQLNSPVASDDRVNGPVLSKDRFYSHVVPYDRKESPVSSQDRFYSHVVSKDRISNPALSSYLNSFVSLKDRLNSPSTVGLDNPVPSLNHLVNNSDLSEDRINSTDNLLNSSNDRLNSSQDDVKSSVLSKARLSDSPLMNQSNEQLVLNSPDQSNDSLGKNSSEIVSKKMKKKKKGLFFRRNSKHKDSMEIIEPTTEPLQTDANETSPVFEGALLENLDMQVNPNQPLPVVYHKPGSATTYEADAHDPERMNMYENSAYDLTFNDSPNKSTSGNRTSNGNFDPDDTQYFTTRHKQNLELLKTMSVFATASNDIIDQQKEDAIKNAIESNLDNYKKSSIFDEIYLDELEDEKPMSNLDHRTSSLTTFLSGSNDVIGRAKDIGGNLKRKSSLLSSLFSKNAEEDDKPEDSKQHPENTSGKYLGLDRLSDTSFSQYENRDEEACVLNCDSGPIKDGNKDNGRIKDNWMDYKSSVIKPCTYVSTSKEMCRVGSQTKPPVNSSSKELTGILRSSKDNIFRDEHLPSSDQANFSSMVASQDFSKAEDQIEELPSTAPVSKDPNSENSSENVQHKHANLQSYLSEFENIHHKDRLPSVEGESKTSLSEIDVEKVIRSSAKRIRTPSDESEPAAIEKNHQMNIDQPQKNEQSSWSKESLKKGTKGKSKFSVFNFLENLLFHDGESSVFKELFAGTDVSDSDSEDTIDIPAPADEEKSLHAKKDGAQIKHVHFGDVSEIEYEDPWSDVDDHVDENFNSSSKPPKPICDKCQGPCIFSPDLFQELLRSQLLAITFINSHTSRILLRRLINERIDICEQINKG